jgi:8-oxo-dGTP pyrophosphatase MutT (NUDIX family)
MAPGDPEAAVTIVRTRAPEESILLIRRAEREGDSWSGHWSLPGGRCEPADRDPLDTALRELKEECGLVLTREQMTAALPAMLARRRIGRFLPVAPFLFDIHREMAVVLDAREAVEALWMPLRVMRDPSRHILLPVPGRPSAMLFPGIALPGAPLWGFTYRLLTAWLGLEPGGDRAGEQAAGRVLDFLLQSGLTLEEAWRERQATVAGSIPVAAVVAHFSAPQQFLAAANCLEVSPDSVRLIGPAFEEYVIRARSEGARDG